MASPRKKVIVAEGDIISLDFGALYKGYYGDSAITVPVGQHFRQAPPAAGSHPSGTGAGHTPSADRQQSFRHLQSDSDPCRAAWVFGGSGVCWPWHRDRLHESPEVPNYIQKSKSSPRIVEGMVLAIEPMVNAGTYKVKVLDDDWTVVTADRRPSAHFEHSVAATRTGPFVLSALTAGTT